MGPIPAGRQRLLSANSPSLLIEGETALVGITDRLH